MALASAYPNPLDTHYRVAASKPTSLYRTSKNEIAQCGIELRIVARCSVAQKTNCERATHLLPEHQKFPVAVGNSQRSTPLFYVRLRQRLPELEPSVLVTYCATLDDIVK